MNSQRNVVIVGGGPCGIEAARAINELGYTSILIEKNDHLGGHLAKWDRLFPEGDHAQDILKSMLDSINGVKWFLNSEIVSINKLKDSYNIIMSNGVSITADAVLLTTGFSLFKAQKKEEYGYGVYDKVITSADLELFFLDKKKQKGLNPKNIGFVHCVGSRDEKVDNRHCSKVCCATAVKQACEIKEIYPDANVICFYMDLRMFGRRYEDMYLEAQTEYGVRFIRGRVSEVSEDHQGMLVVKAEDTFTGKPLKITMDMLVLMSGMTSNPDTDTIVKMLSLPIADDGFLKSKENILKVNYSSKPGLFYAGACLGPKTIPESLSEARAAALSINEYLIGLKQE